MMRFFPFFFNLFVSLSLSLCCCHAGGGGGGGVGGGAQAIKGPFFDLPFWSITSFLVYLDVKM